jgi:Ca-activated chloride channel family protein
MRVRLDEDQLKRIAEMTRAEYFNAGTAAELTKVYRTLNTRLVLERKNTEITVFLAAIGAAFALASASLSLLWFNRIV